MTDDQQQGAAPLPPPCEFATFISAHLATGRLPDRKSSAVEKARRIFRKVASNVASARRPGISWRPDPEVAVAALETCPVALHGFHAVHLESTGPTLLEARLDGLSSDDDEEFKKAMVLCMETSMRSMFRTEDMPEDVNHAINKPEPEYDGKYDDPPEVYLDDEISLADLADNPDMGPRPNVRCPGCVWLEKAMEARLQAVQKQAFLASSATLALFIALEHNNVAFVEGREALAEEVKKFCRTIDAAQTLEEAKQGAKDLLGRLAA